MGIRTELTLRLVQSPGALSAVCRILSDQRVSVVALSLEAGGQLHLLVDNHVGAAGVLRGRHYQVTERDVLVTSVSHGPGALQPLLQRIADAGVTVDYVYGGAVDVSDLAVVVVAVDDARRASAATGI